MVVLILRWSYVCKLDNVKFTFVHRVPFIFPILLCICLSFWVYYCALLFQMPFHEQDLYNTRHSSIHCWETDDRSVFVADSVLSKGLANFNNPAKDGETLMPLMTVVGKEKKTHFGIVFGNFKIWKGIVKIINIPKICNRFFWPSLEVLCW